MMGAIIGDIVGSRFEFNNHRSKDFVMFTEQCFATDDSIMTLAIADAIMKCNGDYTDLGKQAVKSMREIGVHYPGCGFGGNFYCWIFGEIDGPYNSFGNGAAMRVSPCAWFAKSLDEAKELSRKVTEVSHNHPEGIKGAEAVTVAIYMALHGKDKTEIRDEMLKYYDLNFTIDEIRPTYRFNEICQQTVPQAIVAFLESYDFEDAIRTAISVGGDSDTLAAITGSIAEAYYTIPEKIKKVARTFLDKRLTAILDKTPE